MKNALTEMGKRMVIGVTLAAFWAAGPALAQAEQPRHRTPEQIAENNRKMQERFRKNDEADAARLRKSMAEAAERAKKKEDERLLAQVDAAEKLGANTSPTGVMVKDAAGNWVNADRSGRPLPPPEPPRKPFDPKAKEAAEKKVREAFERDRQKALEDQAKRDRAAEDEAARRRAAYGLKPGEDAGPTGIMIKVGGNWVPAGLDGKPIPGPRPKVDPARLGAVPPKPGEAEKAKRDAEARVRDAFARDRQKALDDAARRDRADDDKAGERLLRYGLPPAAAPIQNTMSARPVPPAPAPSVSALTYAIPAVAPRPAPKSVPPAPAPSVSVLTYAIPAVAPRPAPKSVLELPRPAQVQAAPAAPAALTPQFRGGFGLSPQATQATQARQATRATQAAQFKAGPVTPAQAAAAAAKPTSVLVIGR